MIAHDWRVAHGRELFRVTAVGRRAASIEIETAACLDAAFAAIREAGLPLEHIVRSRLWARDAEARRRASDTRRAMLADRLRGASASLIAPTRLSDDASMAIDLIVLRAGAPATEKTIAEYDPPIAPPEYVALDGMVFLSGNTSTAPGFDTQLARIHDQIHASLGKAGATWSSVVHVSAFVSGTLDQDGTRRQIRDRFPKLACPFEVASVGGFSAPEKLVEIEVTADLR
ncbi:MAG TPA: Rid family hydrolase [Beijerinckiaceae bacterium]|jgi:enamine deaminase RidA (YjgF/YER057c/UK114 family)